MSSTHKRALMLTTDGISYVKAKPVSFAPRREITITWRSLEDGPFFIFQYGELIGISLTERRIKIWKDAPNVGDTIRVIDPEISLNSYLRIIKMTRNLLAPHDIKLELSNRRTPLLNLISQLSGRQGLLM